MTEADKVWNEAIRKAAQVARGNGAYATAHMIRALLKKETPNAGRVD